MDTDYDNFDLLIERGTNSYRALVLNASFGKGAFSEFTLPFSQKQLATWFWVSDRSRKLVSDIQDVEGQEHLTPRYFGEEMYKAVFKDPLGLNLILSYQDARQRKVGLRLRLCFSADVTELADLPWEFLWTPAPMRGDFLALYQDTPLVRYPLIDSFSQTFTVAPPLRILVMLSNPRDVAPLNVEEEFRRLQQALEKLQSAGAIELEKLEDATLDALNQSLHSGNYHVFHFIGHGFFDTQSNQGGLVFETDTGDKHEISAEQLWNELRKEDSLRLIFLNACEGARSGSEDFFAGVAQQLVQKGIPAVLAMQFEISDQAAIALAHAFYQNLAEGRPLDGALVAAREAVRRTGNELEWATPVLFSRQEHLNLLGTLGTSDGPTYNGPTHPKTKAELQSLDLRIPDRVVVRNILFAPRTLVIGEQVSLEQPIYAQGDIHIGKDSHVKSHLFAGGSVFLDTGVVVEGDILIKGAQLVMRDRCIVRGVVRAEQTVKTGVRCKLTDVSARQVELGRRSSVDFLRVTGDARLEDGVTLGSCSVKQRLTLASSGGSGIEIEGNAIASGSIEWPETAQLRIGGVVMDRSNLFVQQGDTLLPGPVSGDLVDQPIVTALLNADLVAAIEECTTVTLRRPTT